MKNILIVFMLGLFGQAHAALIDSTSADPALSNDATFEFGGFTWNTEFHTGDGSIGTGDEANVGADLTITGSNNHSGVNAETFMTTTASTDGWISFNWDYTTFDPPSVWDPFLWLYGSTLETVGETFITDVVVANQSGFWEFFVTAGDVFGLSILTDNFQFTEGAFVDITAFTFSALGVSPVPLPAAFLLFGIGIAGLSLVRKKSPA